VWPSKKMRVDVGGWNGTRRERDIVVEMRAKLGASINTKSI
jgi:hypothetical protein